jgi:hypothetical protein
MLAGDAKGFRERGGAMADARIIRALPLGRSSRLDFSAVRVRRAADL